MIRTFLFCVLFITAVSANDIYVTQSQTTEETTTENTNTPFQEPLEDSEKILISNESKQYCSVVAGCFQQNQ